MTRLLGILSVLLVVLLAMAFAAGNAGQQVTLHLGIVTLYRVPVTLVAFGGLLAGMLVMFSTGIYTDLKVRKILRDRLAEESRNEQGWIDRNQRDLFAETDEAGGGDVQAHGAGGEEVEASGAGEGREMIPAVAAMDTPQPAEPVTGTSEHSTPTESPAAPEKPAAEEYPAEQPDQEETRTE